MKDAQECDDSQTRETDLAATRRRPGLRVFLAAYAAMPPLVIWLVLAFPPIKADSALRFDAFALAAVLGASAIEFALALLFLANKRPLAMLIAFTCVSTGIAVAMGGLIHRDFFSACFMHFIQAIAATLRFSAFMRGGPISEGSRKRLFAFALAASALWTGWLILMGYAIVTRAEPRWAEAIVYNIYNTGLAAILYSVVFALSLAPIRAIRAEEGRFLVDGIDFSPILGKGPCLAAYHLMNRKGRVTCAEMVAAETGRECGDCANMKARACADYRNIYNSVRLLRRLVEVMRLGSIDSAENKNKIVGEGWLYVPDRFVRIDRPSSGT